MGSLLDNLRGSRTSKPKGRGASSKSRSKSRKTMRAPKKSPSRGR